MTEKYKGKYRIQSARLKKWDYGSNGYYFVTINTKNREHYFGNIGTDAKFCVSMQLSELGKIANQCWVEIPDHFLFVELDKYVVMPDHVHGIIRINKNNSVQTQNFASVPNKFGPQSQNLASIIRGFKTGVTKYARQNYIKFQWQPRYHDHIIRDNGELQRIRNYIINNPKNWENDENNN